MSTGPGSVLGGRYRLEERIAGGGMGDVWRAGDEVLGRTVAVKILLPALLDEQGFAERFRGEARTMATISHPGVVNVYDYGSDPTVAYLVMEHVHGDPLSRILSQVGRLTAGRTMALVAQAAEALQAAHDKGIVHRDVKPGNLLVRPNGTLVLVDFGIARSAIVGQLTAAGSVLGTASYISPEQASGAVATPLSDIYALGVVAYQCLSGRRPFEGGNPVEIAMKHVREQPSPLPEDVPPPVRAIVERAMDKDPARRYPNATAFAVVARQASRALSGRSGRAPTASGAAAAARPGQPPSGAPPSGAPVRPGSTRVMSPQAAPTSGPDSRQAPGNAPARPATGSPAVPPARHSPVPPARQVPPPPTRQAPVPPARQAPPPPTRQSPAPPAGPAPAPRQAPGGPGRPSGPPQGQPGPAPVPGGPVPGQNRPGQPAGQFPPPGYTRGSASVPPSRAGAPHGIVAPGGFVAPGARPSGRRRATLAVWLLIALAILLLCVGGRYLARLGAAAAEPGVTRSRPALAAPGDPREVPACQARCGTLMTVSATAGPDGAAYQERG